jgi:hypothetical protein
MGSSRHAGLRVALHYRAGCLGVTLALQCQLLLQHCPVGGYGRSYRVHDLVDSLPRAGVLRSPVAGSTAGLRLGHPAGHRLIRGLCPAGQADCFRVGSHGGWSRWRLWHAWARLEYPPRRLARGPLAWDARLADAALACLVWPAQRAGCWGCGAALWPAGRSGASTVGRGLWDNVPIF